MHNCECLPDDRRLAHCRTLELVLPICQAHLYGEETTEVHLRGALFSDATVKMTI